eukprot:SAG11_NODE_1097_length_5882_cov_3.116376_3_plen_68_part_00
MYERHHDVTACLPYTKRSPPPTKDDVEEMETYHYFPEPGKNMVNLGSTAQNSCHSLWSFSMENVQVH